MQHKREVQLALQRPAPPAIQTGPHCRSIMSTCTARCRDVWETCLHRLQTGQQERDMRHPQQSTQSSQRQGLHLGRTVLGPAVSAAARCCPTHRGHLNAQSVRSDQYNICSVTSERHSRDEPHMDGWGSLVAGGLGCICRGRGWI